MTAEIVSKTQNEEPQINLEITSETLMHQLELAREEETLELSRARFDRNTNNLNEHRRGSDGAIGKVIIDRIILPFSQAIREFMEPSEKVLGWNGGRKAKVREVLRALGLEPDELALCTLKSILNEFFRPDSANLLSSHALRIIDTLLRSAEFKEYRQFNSKEARLVEKRILRKKGAINNGYGKSVIQQARNLAGLPAVKRIPKGYGVQTGVKLIELMNQSTGLFSVEKISRGSDDTPYVLKASPEMLTLIQTSTERFAELKPQYQMMLIPPKPWTGMFNGGYHIPLKALHPSFVKCFKREVNELKHYKMPKVLEAVNIVQNTRWLINRKIYETAQTIWDMGGNRGGLCSRDEKPVPPKPWGEEYIGEEALKRWKEAHPDEYKVWYDQAQAVYKFNKHSGATRLRVAYQLRIAQENVQYPVVYFPWTCDFRGRLYALPSYVNPQADDLGKALLTFADTKELGEAGAYWLKIHLANCAGVDKVSFEERIKWVMEHELEILSSAKDPMANRFWEDVDSPFQFLAACFEYQGLHEQGISYRSSLPVAMDGTCNGLQHLSAMLRDPVGGEAVNLVPSMKPSDIYTKVLNVLKRTVEQDIASDSTEATQKLIAEAWLPHLDRKITKRPVMTTPYGVSSYGIREQVRDQIIERDLFRGYAINQKEFLVYLTERIEKAIREVIVAAPTVMGWLQEAARRISEKDMHAEGISWSVPGSGFRVIQRYYADQRVDVNVFLGSQRIRVRVDEPYEKCISGRRQISGISPNVIHSLDASMLVQTVRTLSKQGICHLALIHDSYGCHACDIPVLHQALRREFVDIYTNHDVLAELKATWEQAYDVQLDPLPEYGNLDIQMVNHSRYFFA